MNNSYFLYAEDEQDDVDILRDILDKRLKHTRIISVADGFALLEYLQQIKMNEAYPSLIILDLRLPKLDGMETLQLLKSDDIYRLIPAMVLSSKATASEVDQCRRLGTDVLSKPGGFREWNRIIELMCSYVDEGG